MTPVGKNPRMTVRTYGVLNSNRKKVAQCSSQNVEIKKKNLKTMTPVGKNQLMTVRTRCLLNSNRKKVG